MNLKLPGILLENKGSTLFKATGQQPHIRVRNSEKFQNEAAKLKKCIEGRNPPQWPHRYA